MTYKAAIVDDSQDYREYVKEVLRTIAVENGEVIDYREFPGAEPLVYEMEDGIFFDIYILDIEMPDMNGMELAKEIRRRKPDCRIIFVTSYSRYALESYEIDAYQYILKDKLAARLPAVLKKLFAEAREERDGAYYIISTDSRQERFRCRDIIRIYKEGKNAVFVTKEHVYKQRTSLSEVKRGLPPEEFIFIERGIIVNLRHVYGIKKNGIELSNGEIAMASRAYSQKVKESITRYWGQRI